MTGFSDVTVYAPDGTIKKVIPAKSLAGRVWDDIRNEFVRNSEHRKNSKRNYRNPKKRTEAINQIMEDEDDGRTDGISDRSV